MSRERSGVLRRRPKEVTPEVVAGPQRKGVETRGPTRSVGRVPMGVTGGWGQYFGGP